MFNTTKRVSFIELRKSSDGIFSVVIDKHEIAASITTNEEKARYFFKRINEIINDGVDYNYTVIEKYDTNTRI